MELYSLMGLSYHSLISSPCLSFYTIRPFLPPSCTPVASDSSQWLAAFNKVVQEDSGSKSSNTKNPIMTRAAFEKQFPKTSQRDIFGKKLFDVFDENGDGSIEYDEFEAGKKGILVMYII